MDIKYSNRDLDRMEFEAAFTAGLPADVLGAYRSRIQALRAAPRERALLQLQSFDVRGGSNGKHVLRVTDEWDLLVAFEDRDRSGERVALVEALVRRTTTKAESKS